MKEKIFSERTRGLYNCDHLGFNYRMSEIHASIGNEQLNKLKNTTYNTFMCIGGMGHAISVAIGVAKSSKKKVGRTFFWAEFFWSRHFLVEFFLVEIFQPKK